MSKPTTSAGIYALLLVQYMYTREGEGGRFSSPPLQVPSKARAVAVQGGYGGGGSTCIINFATSSSDGTVSCFGV